MNGKPLRHGIVGTGFMADVHARAVRRGGGVVTLVAAVLCGVGLILLGIQGLLRPVVLTRVAKIRKEEMTREVSIGSDVLHGALSLAMAAALLVGIIMKYVVKI